MVEEFDEKPVATVVEEISGSSVGRVEWNGITWRASLAIPHPEVKLSPGMVVEVHGRPIGNSLTVVPEAFDFITHAIEADADPIDAGAIAIAAGAEPRDISRAFDLIESNRVAGSSNNTVTNAFRIATMSKLLSRFDDVSKTVYALSALDMGYATSSSDSRLELSFDENNESATSDEIASEIATLCKA